MDKEIESYLKKDVNSIQFQTKIDFPFKYYPKGDGEIDPEVIKRFSQITNLLYLDFEKDIGDELGYLKDKYHLEQLSVTNLKISSGSVILTFDIPWLINVALPIMVNLYTFVKMVEDIKHIIDYYSFRKIKNFTVHIPEDNNKTERILILPTTETVIINLYFNQQTKEILKNEPNIEYNDKIFHQSKDK